MTKREHLTTCLISAGKLIEDLDAACKSEKASDYGDLYAMSLLRRQAQRVAKTIEQYIELIDDAKKEVEAGR